MIPAIYDRRSIRKFLDRPLTKEDITQIIRSGMKAPSSKNRQPWKFIVVQGREKAEMLKAFRRGISREERGIPLLPESRQHIVSAKYTAEIMDEAPAARPRKNIEDTVIWRG
ncbi:MAG: nitroreductase family protein [Lachnospiraceae bacterium]|nr:nitroreductase family protein [Lachnospiraceae bacterium]